MNVLVKPGADLPASHRPVPRDTKAAITFMRKALCRQVSLKDIAEYCSVPERTLNGHFRRFIDVSPMHYLRRLRLAAAREALLAGTSDSSVTAVAKRYQFNHFGRFAAQYCRTFGESPAATLRRRRTVPPSDARKPHNMAAQHNGSRADSRVPLPSRTRPSIAVLPCRVFANEPVLTALAESVAEGVGAALSSVRSLAVIIPRSLRAATADPQCLARELNARYVLTGRLMQVDARLRFILCLAECASGHHIWGDSFDGAREQPFELQDRIVAGVLRAILPSIRGAEIERVRHMSAQNLDAYGLTMRALPFVFASQPQATRRALELLHQAMEIDPDYGLATALAAWCHGQLVMYNGTTAPTEDKSQALKLAQRAAILDDDDPLILAARCAVHTMAREFDIAEALVTRALAMDPYNGWAWGRSGWLQSYEGNSEAAIEHFGRALALEPNAAARANSFIGIGGAHFNAGRYEAAAVWLRRALLEQPGTQWANRSLSVSYAHLGERLKALESLDTLRRFCPDLTVSQVVAALPFQPDFLKRLGDGLSELGLPP